VGPPSSLEAAKVAVKIMPKALPYPPFAKDGAPTSSIMQTRKTVPRALNGCLLLAVMAMFAGNMFGQATPPLPSTAFTLDLRSYGWEAPEGRQHVLNKPSIVVDHQGRVVLGFTVRARSGVVTRNQPSLDFRITRFSSDGKVSLSLSLPTHVRGRNAIYLSDDDRIIARANDSVRFLEPSDGSLQEGAWKTLCAESCRVAQSRTRRTLVLSTESADPPLTIVRFSPELALRRCGKAARFIQSTDDKIQNYTDYITDEFVYFHNWEPESGYFTYRWPLCDYEHRVEIPPHVGGRWAVLSDDTFLAYPYSKQTKDEELEVISSDGQVKFRPTMQAHEVVGTIWTPIKSSAKGDVIAVDLLTVKGRSWALDLSGHVTARRIAVYDIEAGKQLASIPVTSTHRYHFEFDLSPDGHRLAILEDDKVRVVDIEGTEKAAGFGKIDPSAPTLP
jgi:hypothetical protein